MDPPDPHFLAADAIARLEAHRLAASIRATLGPELLLELERDPDLIRYLGIRVAGAPGRGEITWWGVRSTKPVVDWKCSS